jgi:hypothetical protein
MSEDKKDWVIPGFKVMEWLRATRDELSLQYLAMSDQERQVYFSKEHWRQPSYFLEGSQSAEQGNS